MKVSLVMIGARCMYFQFAHPDFGVQIWKVSFGMGLGWKTGALKGSNPVFFQLRFLCKALLS